MCSCMCVCAYVYVYAYGLRICICIAHAFTYTCRRKCRCIREVKVCVYGDGCVHVSVCRYVRMYRCMHGTCICTYVCMDVDDFSQSFTLANVHSASGKHVDGFFS